MEKTVKEELISALADGQLQGEEFARAVEAAAGDSKALASWQAYHLVGDVLRSGELALGGTGAQPAAFLARFQLRLEQEAEPARAASAIDSIAANAPPVRSAAVLSSEKEPANDPSFRWKLVAGFASLAAVAAIGWAAVGGLVGRAEQGQMAAAPQAGVAVAGAERPVMIRDPRLDELLAAHRQFGGTTALQMPAGFLRNATFEGPAR
ncbi:MAG: sigma-E factor negative regulatory protein [Burkholderiales bacterium]|nr:sigma-E factor negative regulatory protein [Burkholderiales bacterium]